MQRAEGAREYARENEPPSGEQTRSDTPTNAYNAPHVLPGEAGGEAAERAGGEAGEGEDPMATMGVSDRFFPLSTATMETSVFDVVHIFSERGISAIPIVDQDGVVLNLYETVDIVVRLYRSRMVTCCMDA